VKYADDLLRLAKEEAGLRAIIEKLIKIRKCYGMKINVKELR
jgi:hypothetical protein